MEIVESTVFKNQKKNKPRTDIFCCYNGPGYESWGKVDSQLNPNQTPVLVTNLPLYVLLKIIWYEFPGKYGGNKFFDTSRYLVCKPGDNLYFRNAIISALFVLSGFLNLVFQVMVTALFSVQKKALSVHTASDQGIQLTKSQVAHLSGILVLYNIMSAAFNVTHRLQKAKNETTLSFTIKFITTKRLLKQVF